MPEAESRCANEDCNSAQAEDDLCSCEGFCQDCHESCISPSCEDNIREADEEEGRREAEDAWASLDIKCPESPRDLGLDPAVWWPGQRESIDLIMDAFVAQGKKFVMAAIPTGGGKTIIASAVQKLLARAHEGDSGTGGSSLALTHTIQLQQQYTKTLKGAAIVTGRGNYPCVLSEGSEYRIGTDPEKPLMADEAPCADGVKCPEQKRLECPYYEQFDAAAVAGMTVMNYAYGARVLPIPSFGEEPNPFHRDLLVGDECHLAERAVVEAAGIKLWTGPLSRIGISMPSLDTRIEVEEGGPRSRKRVRYESVPVWISWAASHQLRAFEHLKQMRAEFSTAKSIVLTEKRGHAEAKAARSRMRSAKVLAESIEAIARISKPEEWIIRRDWSADKRVVSATVQPLFGWTSADDLLFKHFHRILLMSATPGDPDVARLTLGLPKEDFLYLERPSTFPRENRPVFYWPITKLNYSSTEAEWDQIARAIGFIASMPAHQQRKGLVHSGSKVNALRLVALINRYLPGRAFTHGSSSESDEDFTREGALEEFRRSPEPRIFVTASFTTGLDLPYIIGWQVIAKVPYGSLGDEITAKRRAFKLENGYAFGQQVYQAECANTIVQATGRIVRAPDDSGPTFILDGNFEMLYKQAYWPKFFLDAFKRFRVDS